MAHPALTIEDLTGKTPAQVQNLLLSRMKKYPTATPAQQDKVLADIKVINAADKLSSKEAKHVLAMDSACNLWRLTDRCFVLADTGTTERGNVTDSATDEQRQALKAAGTDNHLQDSLLDNGSLVEVGAAIKDAEQLLKRLKALQHKLKNEQRCRTPKMQTSDESLRTLIEAALSNPNPAARRLSYIAGLANDAGHRTGYGNEHGKHSIHRIIKRLGIVI